MQRAVILALAIATGTSLVATLPASAQVRRNEQERPPSMTLEEYEPPSAMKVTIAPGKA